MRATRILLVIFLATTVALAGRPVARWDVVPDQRIASSFKVGTVAFHPDGVKVEFRVNGTLVHTANNPTLNDRVNVWEYWFTFDPSSYTDGAVTIDAKAICLNGTDPDYDLPSLNLYANSGGSLDVADVTWVDSVNGSDANTGGETDPYLTLDKAVDNTTVGGTIYLKAGSYSPDAINAGMTRAYWTTISAAPGLGWDDVEVTTGRPKTDKLRLKNLSLATSNTSGVYTTILFGEQGATAIWLDDVRAWNKNGRYAAQTFVLGNGYTAYTTGGTTTQTATGPNGALVRDHHVQTIGSDVWSGGSRLVVNCSADDTDVGPTSWHPDFHQSYAVDPDYCENVILYNVRGTNQNCQGLFGVRLRNAAFVNVMLERVPDTDYRSQYSTPMENVFYSHVTLINQSWYWRGLGAAAFTATDVTMNNCVMVGMHVIEDADVSGLTVDRNHFTSTTNVLGTNYTTGDPLYTDPTNEDFTLQGTSPALATGTVLQCVPADIDGAPYDTTTPNKGAYSDTAWLTADAGPDQTVLDREDDGAQDVVLDGRASFEPTGTITSYLWEEGVTQLATDSLARVNLAVGTHTIKLTVTNDSNVTDSDTISVTVEALTGPMQKLSLDLPATDRITVPTDLVWPNNSGEADICLWEDDKYAAASITIDDNIAVDHSWWNGLSTQYGWNFTWFIITGGIESGTNPTYNGTWPVWNTMFGLGHGVESHSWSHHSDDDTRPEDEVIREYLDSQQVIQENIPGNDTRFFAWPYGNYNPDIAKIYAAGARGVSGGPNRAQRTNYLNTNSGSGDCGPDYIDCVLDGTSGISWMNKTDWLRGWAVSHFHQVNNKTDVEADLAYIASREDELWVGLFGDVAKYGQERDSATLTVTTNNASQIVFTLTDEMDDTVFDYPLTVKVKLYPGWATLDVTQDGTTIESTIVDNNGDRYVLVKAVPDKGDVVIMPLTGGNLIPTADAGADQVLVDIDDTGAEDVTLDGSASYDSDGSVVSYVWEEDATQIATGASATVSLNVGTHTVVLTVTDDDNVTDTDNVVITVAPVVVPQNHVITGDGDDQEIRDTGTTQWYGQASHRVGGNTSTTDAASVYVFALPTMAPGEEITAANLEFNLESISNTPSFGIDLYGLGYRTASTVETTDYFEGGYDTDTSDAWALQDDILTVSTPTGVISTDATADTALAAYLQAQYDAGAVGGDYVFLRLNPDVENAGSYYYFTVTSANGTNKPVLTIDTGAANLAPQANAGADQTVNDADDSGDESITLDGSASTDRDGTITSYEWTESATPLATVVSPVVTLAVGVHTIDLTVTDDDAATDTDSVVIDVTAYVNVIPVADAGADQSVIDADDSGTEDVTLDGSGSSDADGTIVDYAWEDDSVLIGTGVSPTVSIAVGMRQIDLIVTDDDGGTGVDSVVITVHSSGTGTTYTVDGHTDDKEIRDNGTSQWVGFANHRVGGNSSTTDAAAVLVFQLPTLAAGETVSSANLDVHLIRISNTPAGAVDLYGLGYRTASTVEATDYYQGVFNGDATDAWALQDDYLTTATTDDTVVGSDATGDAALASYLAAQYAAGAQGGDYVFFRLNCDVTNQGDYNYWEVTSANSTPKPVLTINTAAEPPNVAPTADAGADQIVSDVDDSGDEDVTLDGAASTDSDGTIASYVWEENLSQIATGATPTVTLSVAVHTIDLIVTDNDGATATDSVTVTVNAIVPATTYVIDGHGDDQEVRDNGSMQWVGQTTHRVGGNTSTTDSLAVLVFELPTLAAGEIISSANLDVELFDLDNSPGGNVDLYGLGYRIASAVQASDYYQGVFDGDTTDAWALQDDYMTLSTTEGVMTGTDATGDAAIAAYLEAQYDAGAVGGDYVFFRLNPDIADVSNYNYWELTSADGTNGPVLTIETVIETTNIPPTADAGVDQTVDDSDSTGAEDVTLDGSASADTDGSIVSYVWTENASQIATGATPTVTLDVGSHAINLTITDDGGASGVDSVLVTITGASPYVTLSQGSLTAYDTQDGTPSTATVGIDGLDITLIGNCWKLHPFTYTVTTDTGMLFTVDAADTGEIAGIVLDDDTTVLNTRNGFRFGGSDATSTGDTWSWLIDPLYTDDEGEVTYFVSVGDYFTGSVSYLGFFADDDADASADVVFDEIKIGECALETFDELDMSAYGTQDGQNNSYTDVTVSTDSLAVTLDGNAWKLHPFSATVTSDTVLIVTVNATDAGEILGIALDNDTDPTVGRRAFIFGGTTYGDTAIDSWSWTFPDPDTGQAYSTSSGSVTYIIPVGEYFTGSVTGIGFIADDDADASTAVTFSDIRLF